MDQLVKRNTKTQPEMPKVKKGKKKSKFGISLKLKPEEIELTFTWLSK